MERLRYIAAMIFPERCPYCSALIEPLEIACEHCFDEIRRKHMPIKGGARGYRCVSSFVYAGKVRRLILRLKFGGRVQFVPQINEILVNDITETYGKNAFDLITCVPLYTEDQRDREYNQSEMLARSLGKMLGVPYADTLLKVKKTKKQHNLKYAERKTNLSGAFQLIDKEIVQGKRILIVDDVITSGYTLGTCAKVLNRGKPEIICCAAIANAGGKYPKETVI